MPPRCRPLLGRRNPAYPTSRETAADPALLWRHTPAGWRGRSELRGALALLLGTGVLGANSGCIFGVPMAIEPLTERDAVRIVKAELSQRGIEQVHEKVELRGVLIANPAGQKEPLVVDLADPQRKWAVEYLTGRDLPRFAAAPENATPARIAAQLESEVTAQAPDTHLKVLWIKSAIPRDQAASARAQRELREQIREFFDWLQAQGAV